MAAKVTTGVWQPLRGSLPDAVLGDTIYLLPTEEAPPGSADTSPRYSDSVQYLPKNARAAGVPVEFATSEAARVFLHGFSVDPTTLVVAVAVAQIANSWLVTAVESFIDTRAELQGWSRKQGRRLPLKVAIAETEGKDETSWTCEIEGSGNDVVEAIRALQGNDDRRGKSAGVPQGD